MELSMKKATSIKIAATSEQLAAEYRAGATTRELAAKYGCSFQNINIRLITYGVAMRPPSKIPTLLPSVCPTCRKVFRPHNSHQVFCCHECVRQKDTCIRGHALTEDNRYHFPSSRSRCKRCQNMRDAAYRARKKSRQS